MRILLALLACSSLSHAADLESTTNALRQFAEAQLATDPSKSGKFSNDLARTINKRLTEANQADRLAWEKLQSKADWEKFRDARIAALKQALGTFPNDGKKLNSRVTKTIDADGYRIDNCLYESRPGLWVTGNLYKPAQPGASCPGFIIAHSHHNPKHEGELQDMGVLWAKLGCYVLVIDQLGHGERRQHPFHDAKSYPEPFRVGRQDYFFRYNAGMQLALVGESLMGWMAWDMMRGVDLLLQQPGIAKDKLIVLGAVAGGGDPAAVLAALDPRINCVCPFNFGGPQPETKYPLPENAAETFNYAGSGSWESTRNLRGSVSGGFLPWSIVASVAPRKVIHAHEFSWDRARDPVWQRYQKVFTWYEASDHLAFAHGRGVIVGNDPNASHCNNIGVIHRQQIYAALKKWYGIPIPTAEPRERRSAAELRCWTPEAIKELQPKTLAALLCERADAMLVEARKQPASFNQTLQQVLGVSTQVAPADVSVMMSPTQELPNNAQFKQVTLRAAQSVDITLVHPAPKDGVKFPVVVVVCQAGSARFLHERAATIAHLLDQGCACAVVEVSGTGAKRPGDSRGRGSSATALSASVQMLGETMLGQSVHDLNAALTWLKSSRVVDMDRLALWGESLATPNAATTVIAVPHEADKQPKLAEPGPASVVAFVAMQHPNMKAVLARGGLVSYRSVLEDPFVFVPHDALPVRIFAATDLPDVWAKLKPAVRLEGLIDGHNQRVPPTTLANIVPKTVSVQTDYSDAKVVATWLASQLTK